MAISRGVKASGGTDFVSGFIILADEVNTDFNTAYSGINNVTIADANVAVAANIDPSKIGDYSDDNATYQTTRPAAARADATDYTILTTSRPTTLEEEIANYRGIFDEAGGYTISTAGNLTADQWYAMFGKGVLFPPTGTMWPSLLSAAPTGWVLANDGSIGDATSGGTTRANKDTRELYNLLWNKYADAICPVTGGRGASSTADFDAHKPMFLPPFCGRVLGIAGTPASHNRTEAITGTMGITGTTPRAGTSTTVFFIDPSNSSTVDSDYNTYRIRFTSGALSGTEQTITGYDGGLHEITVGVAFGGTPAAGVTYVIYPVASQTTLALVPFTTFSPKDDIYNAYTIETTGGTGSGQTRTISDYDGSKHLITISAVWTTQPDYTTTFSIYKTVSTRSLSDRAGADTTIPTIDIMPAHAHPSVMGTGSNASGHTDDSGVMGFDGTIDSTTDNGAFPAIGSGSAFSTLQPTFFMNWIIKL